MSDSAAVQEAAKAPNLTIHPEFGKYPDGTPIEQPGFLFVFITFLISFVSPLIFVTLQHFGPKYFKMLTLAMMWIFGFLFAVAIKAHIFIVLWIIYSFLNFNMYFRAKNQSSNPNTPRIIYKYFLFTFKLNYFCAVASLLIFLFYSMIFVDPIVANRSQIQKQDMLMYVFVCALYFGVLNRDFAEISAETIAVRIGYYSPDALAKKSPDYRVCGICNKLLLNPDMSRNQIEMTQKLSCQHEFHDFCIKGWCLIGKKNVCPYCREKVDLKRMFSRPWDKVDQIYGSMLDTFRYFTGWMPAVILIWKFNIKIFHLS